jgi:S1-C subfamily serine protease
MSIKRSNSSQSLNGQHDSKKPALNNATYVSEEIIQDDDISIDESSSSDSESLVPKSIPNDTFINGQWRDTIDKVVKSVVSIHFTQTTSFDCDPPIVSEATGFVVDAEKGIILTNRHVVGAGPFTGYAIFDNHEETVVKPIYRDPVHDFGFLKFNPSDIKYMKIQSLELRPELAQVGCEIRVVGNDAGEKLSILSGFISRLDRNAPEYGGLTYNDFNTEYIQAAASASGGSSGSPVVDVNGYAVALQAGGSTDASTDFFLPLYRVKRALDCIQTSKPITRGTIQVQWILRPFDECRRLGLSDEVEKQIRSKFPKIIGLLVAEVVLPEGPADGLIKEGDTLVSINGQDIITFIKVDEIFDSSIGENVEIAVQRNGEIVTINCKVQNLHSITPDRLLSVAGASFNDMSYQMARIYAIPVKGVFINNATASFLLDKTESQGWVLDTLNDIDIKDLDHLIEVMKLVADKERVSIKFRHISDLHSPSVTTLYIDRHWCTSFRLSTRNDETGLWDFRELGDPLPPVDPLPKSVKFIDIPIEYPECAKLSKTLILVSSVIHVPVDAFPGIRARGYGLIIDAERGYAIISRRVVPHDCLDVNVSFAESLIIPATVEFLHPTQNYAIIKYDPSLIQTELITPKFSTKPLERGEKVVFIGHNNNMRVVTTDTKVADITTVNIPRNVVSPRYRASNLETVSFDTNLTKDCASGIITDQDGTIRALWLSFLGETQGETDTVYRMGLDVTELQNVLKLFQKRDQIEISNNDAEVVVVDKSTVPSLKIVDAEFVAISLAQARIMGVSDEWIAKMEESNSDRLQFISVSRVTCPEVESQHSLLEPGDIVLSIEGMIAYTIQDITSITDKDFIKFLIVRRKKEIEVNVPCVEVKSSDHLVFWAGAILQAPHHAVRQSLINLQSQVYVTSRGRGSPAKAYGISPTNFITHVSGIPTPTLEEFVKVVRTIPDETYVKLRLVSFDNIPFAISIKTNYHYFPTGELKKDSKSGKWIDIEYDEKNNENIVKEV